MGSLEEPAPFGTLSEPAEEETPREWSASHCPLCAAKLAGARCEDCGAAVRPGGYEVLSLLAQRPHGRVYLARAPDGSRVALKEMVYAAVPDVSTLDAFERESALLQQL